MIFISIVIPTHNEARRIGPTLQKIRRFVEGRPEKFELIVADDDSSDATCEVVQREAAGMTYSLLHIAENRGKGSAVRRGMLAAKGDFVLFSDADLSTPIEELDKLLAALNAGADAAYGSRALAESDVQVHQNFIRETMGKVFNRCARILVFRDVRDSQCGFKCFRRDVAHALFSRSKLDGFCFDAEITYLAQKKGYRIQEVPVVWQNDTQTKVHILADPLKMFWDLFRIRWLHRKDE